MNLGYCNDTEIELSPKIQDDWSRCFMKNLYFDLITSQAATISLTALEIVGICCNCLILKTLKVKCIIRSLDKKHQMFYIYPMF